jgi:2-polyprenyl-3-methyl-5-hydroxy-6-metoxy-1,4-benzoquinol methylase
VNRSEYKEYKWNTGPTCAHEFLYPTLRNLLQNHRDEKILDVGCGNGEIANRLIDEGFDVIGMDASVTGIEIANRKNSNKFYVHNINSPELPLALQGLKFNIIISTEVIEHLYNPREYIKFCRSMLADNGKMIISTPYHGYLKNLALAITGKLDEHFTALWDGGHIKFWSIRTLTKLFNEFNFDIVEFKGSGRLPYLWKSIFAKVKVK